jgi:hypothetical protein
MKNTFYTFCVVLSMIGWGVTNATVARSTIRERSTLLPPRELLTLNGKNFQDVHAYFRYVK